MSYTAHLNRECVPSVRATLTRKIVARELAIAQHMRNARERRAHGYAALATTSVRLARMLNRELRYYLARRAQFDAGR
jgi:hypothetical protein